jgi:hypothetical protein
MVDRYTQVRLFGSSTRLDRGEAQRAWSKLEQIWCVLVHKCIVILYQIPSITGYDQLTRAKSVNMKINIS